MRYLENNTTTVIHDIEYMCTHLLNQSSWLLFKIIKYNHQLNVYRKSGGGYNAVIGLIKKKRENTIRANKKRPLFLKDISTHLRADNMINSISEPNQLGF